MKSRPLRAKLIASTVGLLAFVCLVIGVVSEIALHGFLVDQIDHQLDEAAHRAQAFADHAPPGQLPLDAPGQAAGTMNVILSGGIVVHAGRITMSGQQEQLDQDQQAGLRGLPADGHAYTRTLGDRGDYRVMALTGNGGVMITGLPLEPAQDTLWTVGLILFGVALAGVTAAGFAGAYAIRRTLRPLDRVAATASQVAELPLDRGDVVLSIRVPAIDTDPRTEVGQVGAALNLMLGHIGQALAARQASEQRVRQFVADASHELRTPLAAIRGYAELTRRGKDQVPPQVAHAMSRIESEAARMTTLVEDLLLLARIDAGKPLEVGEVDLSRMVVDAVSDAHVAGPGHNWRLRLTDEPVVVYGDPMRLHQILANLLSNGRVHTPPGTTVTTSLTRSADGNAVLTVTDDGPGIDRDLLPAVFERFARGDSSRSRVAGSTGLGMAIVSAVVIAHRGTVGVTSRPGRTEFEVRLPTQVSHSVATRLPQVSS